MFRGEGTMCREGLSWFRGEGTVCREGLSLFREDARCMKGE